MSNSTCNISSMNDLLNQAQAGRLNITTVVTSCPDICALAWGSGNPDLSGIGANVSYILQAVLTFLCGPVLCLVYEQRTRWKFSDHVQKHISTLHNSFLDISAQFSIPVAIASVIRYYQQAPFYELAFLRTLTTMQFLSLLATSVTTGLFEDDYHRRPKRVVIIVLYGLLEFGFYMGLIGSLVASQVTWETVSELSEACKTYGKIFPWIKHLSPPSKIHLPHLPTKSNDLKTWKVHLVYSLVAIGGLVGLVLAFFVIRFTIRTLGRILRGRKDWRPFIIPMSSAFTIAMIVEVVEMERLRDVMKTITGADFQDNQWGFGQVIALFLWVPLCSQIAYYILR